MKSRYLKIGLALVTLLIYPAVAVADSAEVVANFAQNAVLSKGGALSVTDDIDYDFGGTAPHEIAYNIPLTYHDDQGRDFRMAFKLVDSKLDGQPLHLTPQVTSATANLTLVPGHDATTTRHFQLRYTLSPVVLNGMSNDIFKYSVTGLAWSVPISKATLRLETPVLADNLTCYTGSQGGTTGGCDITQAGNIVTVNSIDGLGAGDGLSIFGTLPRGSLSSYLVQYEAPTNPVQLIAGVAEVALGVLVALFLVVAWRRRRTRRAIVRAGSPDYTNANEAAKTKAQRK